MAHHDDEVLFAGGLLLSLKNKANIYITCLSKPRLHRKDTATREKSFEKVCNYLGVKDFYLTRFYDLGQHHEKSQRVDDQKKEMVIFLKKLIKKNNINVVISHNPSGEYGHFYHKVVSEVASDVVSLLGNLSFVVFGVNSNSSKRSFSINYDPEEKKKLFEFYEPHWRPSSYDFAYAPEVFFKEE